MVSYSYKFRASTSTALVVVSSLTYSFDATHMSCTRSMPLPSTRSARLLTFFNLHISGLLHANGYHVPQCAIKILQNVESQRTWHFKLIKMASPGPCVKKILRTSQLKHSPAWSKRSTLGVVVKPCWSVLQNTSTLRSESHKTLKYMYTSVDWSTQNRTNHDPLDGWT